jgi:hypothetical protein
MQRPPTTYRARLSILALAAGVAGCASAGVNDAATRLEPGATVPAGARYVVLPARVEGPDSAGLAQAAHSVTVALRERMLSRGLTVAQDTVVGPTTLVLRPTLISYARPNHGQAVGAAAAAGVISIASGIAVGAPAVGLARCTLRTALHAPDGTLLGEMLTVQDGRGGRLSTIDKCAHAVAAAIEKAAQRQ